MSEKASSQADKKHTAEEYLKGERESSAKSEFNDGQILGKNNSNRWHNLIATNTAIAVGSRLHNHKCDIYVNAMCVQLKSTRYCYPDVVIVNGEPQFADNNFDVLTNPTVIVEVFSGKTNTSDKTEKLENYLAMDSIRECLLIKEDEMRVEHYFKQNPKQWIYRIYDAREDVISIESINCKISLAEIYTQVKFGQVEAKSQSVN